jgi:hypothetical protein
MRDVNIYRQASLDRFVKVPQRLLERLALRGASRYRWHFGPETTFLSLVHYNLYLHRRLSCVSHRRCFATLVAKYVSIMSAPARLIPVSTSIVARSSSSQPLIPAARIIEYSPDTL